MKRLFVVLLLIPAMAAAQALAPSPQCLTYDNPNDGRAALDMYAHHVAESVAHRDFSRVIVMMREWETPKCVLDNGVPRMAALLPGFNKAFGWEQDWSKSAAIVKAFRDRYPKEPVVALLEATYWQDYAWKVRGNGYANTVAPDAWKTFHAHLEKSEKMLLESRPYASGYPGWYSSMIAVQSALGRPQNMRDEIFFEGIRRFHFSQGAREIAGTMVTYLSPRWGGSWEGVDNLVAWTTEHTKEDVGTAMYAILYESIASHFDNHKNFFKGSKVSWPKMKNGFKDAIKHFPKATSYKSKLLYWSCAAEDKKAYVEARKMLTAKELNGLDWNGSIKLASCDIIAGIGK